MKIGSLCVHPLNLLVAELNYVGYQVISLQWVIPEKIHIPPTDDKLKILAGGGVDSSGNPGGRGGSEPKNSSSGVTFNLNLNRYVLNTQ